MNMFGNKFETKIMHSLNTFRGLLNTIVNQSRVLTEFDT